MPESGSAWIRVPNSIQIHKTWDPQTQYYISEAVSNLHITPRGSGDLLLALSWFRFILTFTIFMYDVEKYLLKAILRCLTF
jgi:hypothetical protein